MAFAGHDGIVKTTVMMPMSLRAAVSMSMPLMPNEASPMKLMHSFSGAASFAPMMRPRP